MVRGEEIVREQWRKNKKLQKNITDYIGTRAERRYWGRKETSKRGTGRGTKMTKKSLNENTIFKSLLGMTS